MTRLVLVPVVEEVMFSGEHGRLVNEKPTNEAIIIRPIVEHKLINNELLVRFSDFSGSSVQQIGLFT